MCKLHSLCMHRHEILSLDTTRAFMSCALNVFDVLIRRFILILSTQVFLFTFKNTLLLNFRPHLIFILMDLKKVLLKDTNTYAFPGLH